MSDYGYADDVSGDVGVMHAHGIDDAHDMGAGDGLPGYPVDGLSGWRAGVFGPGRGLLGMGKVSDLVARPGDKAPATLQFGGDDAPFKRGGDARLMLASDPRKSSPTVASDGRQTYPMPSAYVPDGHGGVRLRPDFGAVHPGAKDFRGMIKELDLPGALVDLARLFGYSAAGAAAADGMIAAGVDPSPRQIGGGVLGIGADVWKAQEDANRDPKHPPKGADRVTNGVP